MEPRFWAETVLLTKAYFTDSHKICMGIIDSVSFRSYCLFTQQVLSQIALHLSAASLELERDQNRPSVVAG